MFPQLELLGMSLSVVDQGQLLDHVFSELGEKRGGWVVTANLDILRRGVLSRNAKGAYDAAELRVADGMPLVWASVLRGQPLPERVAGSTMTLALAARAAQEGRSLFLLGGDAGAADGCKAKLEEQHPGLRILGTSNPWVSSPARLPEVDAMEAEVREICGDEEPDILLVGLGSPKQEYAIQALRKRFPKTWMIGVGITFSFVAGQVERAPEWMQRTGVEWVHRMVQDPKRLVRRYLIDDVPFAALLFADAVRKRFTDG